MKRIRSCFLCFWIALSLLSVQALAQSDDGVEPDANTYMDAPEQHVQNRSADIASGKCGIGLTWTLDSGGKLTISGTGAMYNYWEKENVPWYSHRESIKTLVVESGVTQIGMRAFYGCKYLTTVSLPEGLTGIGKYAFMLCERLPAITIPSSVTTILNEAFGYCEALKNVVLPDGLTEVGVWLFFGCNSLESVTIPDSVTEICESAFVCCYKLKSIDIPDSVRSIGDSAFYACETLKTVTIPEGVTSIGESAFSQCHGLTDVYLSSTVTSIGKDAFYNCNGLRGIWVKEGNSAYSSDEYGVLFNQDKTALLRFPDACRSSYTIPNGVQRLDNSSFASSNIASLTIPDTVTAIEHCAFAWCEKLKSLTIPASVTTIGDYAFEYCTELKAVWVDEGNPCYSNDAYGVVLNRDKTKLVLCPGGFEGSYTVPAGVLDIGTAAFHDCGKLTAVTLPSGVKTIGEQAFIGCENLTAVTLPDTLEDIGQWAFAFCEKLPCITIPASVTVVRDYAFQNCWGMTTIQFLGDAPQFPHHPASQKTFTFDNIEATVKYPMGNSTWTSDVMQDYGGTLTWEAVCYDHVWSEWSVITAPTCGQAGLETHACTVCGATESREMDTLEHSFGEWIVTTAPGYETAGEETLRCARCDAINTRPLPSLQDQILEQPMQAHTVDGKTVYEITVPGSITVLLAAYAPQGQMRTAAFLIDGDGSMDEQKTIRFSPPEGGALTLRLFFLRPNVLPLCARKV